MAPVPGPLNQWTNSGTEEDLALSFPDFMLHAEPYPSNVDIFNDYLQTSPLAEATLDRITIPAPSLCGRTSLEETIVVEPIVPPNVSSTKSRNQKRHCGTKACNNCQQQSPICSGNAICRQST